ncbi:MAG: outer membrane receptor for Fe3+-dicitrate [Woeseiaceae bacterium]|jgi:outer membrane receptor for Fe3+-dicitrate
MQTNLARSLLLLAFVGLSAGAQEAETEAAAQAQAAEIEALEPGLSSDQLTEDLGENSADAEPTAPVAVLAPDVRRRESSSGVMDEIDLGRTEITGNQELPKVLYIVPWQKSDPGVLTGKPVNSLLDEVLAPIDRSEFIRQVDYYGDLNAKEE